MSKGFYRTRIISGGEMNEEYSGLEITEEGSSRTDEYRASVDFAFDCDWKTGLLKLSRSFL